MRLPTIERENERMNLSFRSLHFSGLRDRIRGMFNLNDPRWGRGEDKNDDKRPDNNNKGPNQGPPDLDELWRDFNRKLGGLFGGGKGRRPDNGGGFGGGGNFQPDMKSAGIGAGLVAAVVILIWLGTGFFIVQEGQQAVITQFGRSVDRMATWPADVQAFITASRTEAEKIKADSEGK